MTKITDARIYLDQGLYKELGSPGRFSIIRDAWDVLLIPAFGISVMFHGKLPYIVLPAKERRLIKKGEFNGVSRKLFSYTVYEIQKACMYYTDFRGEE